MIFNETCVEGAFFIERQPNQDERGYFARLYCEEEFHAAGIEMVIQQMNLCENKEIGTLRGLHFQKDGYEEDKLVACTRGKIYDVCADIRPASPTYLQYCAYELSEENGGMLYIPKGCAHGYVTLANDCQILYLMSQFYMPGYDSGYRYDDPAFHINWPIKEGLIISAKDQTLPYINPMVRETESK